MIRIKILVISLFVSSFVFSQENNEMLFTKGKYEEILRNSINLESSDDYYWNSLILDRQGESLKAIDVLKDGTAKYANNQLLEKLLIELLYTII